MRRWRFVGRGASVVAVAVVGVLTAACSTVQNDPKAGDGSSGGAGGASATTTATTGGGASGAAGTGGLGFGGDTGQPVACEVTCSDGMFCSYGGMQGDCGDGADGTGECVPVPAGCSDPGPAGAVCGCDGTIYDTICAAHEAGVDVGSVCVAPAGDFTCGYRFCTAGEQACAVDVVYASVQCIPLPDSCKPGGGPAPDCSCWMPLPCDACDQDAAGNFVLDCPSKD